MTPLESIREIAFPAEVYAQLVGHARRKLRGEYLPEEEQRRKAYGLLGGRITGTRVDVTHVCPLINNLRYAPDVKPWVDAHMDEAAVQSETPLDRRGWVADPAEVMRAERTCEADGSDLFGNYHMHRVPWESDPRRDTCTEIDTRLAEGCGQWVLILSMVDPERPVLRAFFEGDNHTEAAVTVSDAREPPRGERAEKRTKADTVSDAREPPRGERAEKRTKADAVARGGSGGAGEEPAAGATATGGPYGQGGGRD